MASPLHRVLRPMMFLYFDDTFVRGVDHLYTITAVGVSGERSGTSTLDRDQGGPSP